MRKVFSLLLIALLVAICSADFAAAQGQGGQRGQRGPGGMGLGGNQSDMISDALVLTDERAEKVKTVCDEVNAAMRSEFSGMQDLSQEERMKAFQEMREKSQAALIEKLAPILTADELAAVKPLLASRGGRTMAEIRALRQIEIDDETRGKLQTVVLLYENTLVTLRPQRQPGPGRQGGEMSEEVRTKMQTARETLLADIQKALTADQVTAWQAQTKIVEEELEKEQSQRGGPQGQGGGQRPERGQGQGRGQRG